MSSRRRRGFPSFALVRPGARVEKAILEEGVFWKVRLLCDENGAPEGEPEEGEE